MDAIEFIKQIVLHIWSYDGVKVIVSSVVLNTLLAVGLAIRQNSFTLSKLADFLKDIALYAAIYYAFKLLGDAAGMGGVSVAVWGIIELKIASAFASNLEEWGVPLPAFISNLTRKPPATVMLRESWPDANVGYADTKQGPRVIGR